MSNCVNINSPEFKNLQLNINLNPSVLAAKISLWQESNGLDKFPTEQELLPSNKINYNLKAVNILSSEKAKQIFEKGEKNNWPLDKILTELQVSKEQKQLILDLNLKSKKISLKDLEKGEYKGTLIEFVEHIISDKDKPVYFRNVNKGEKILIVKKGFKELFDKKAWRISATQKDGSKSTPLKDFKSEEEFLNFVLLHEKAHEYIFKNSEETIGQYEDRINQEAYRLLNTNLREEIITDLLANYSYTIEINTAKVAKGSIDEGFERIDGREEGQNTATHSNLTVPGGTNYTENEIATPAITPSIKGHAQFATPNGIGWFRSDEQAETVLENYYVDYIEALNKYVVRSNINGKITTIPGSYNSSASAQEQADKMNKPSQIRKLGEEVISSDGKTRRILEVQSDWGQKQRKSDEPDINIKYDIQQIINDLQKSGDLKIDCN